MLDTALRPQTILNVDDYAPGRYARTKFLTQAGFDVREASTGFDALDLAAKVMPQLMILDVNLPDISGLEVCQRIKKSPSTSGIIVLHLSATHMHPADMVRGLETGADSYLTEPVDPDVLVATVRALLRARDAEESLRRSNEELQQFAYTVAHELAEPLRTIVLSAQALAKNESQTGELSELMRHAEAAARRMQSFVKDVLGFAQMTAPARDASPVSAEVLLGSALLALDVAIKESGAIITHDPLPVVLGNEMRLSHVFSNLIGNALKYRRPDETPRIHIGVREQGEYWMFSFCDNGIGIAPQYQERIFQMFKRLHGAEYPGTGIGLALCKRVVEDHGGTITVESELGKGSVFHLTLRRVRSL